MVKDHLAPFLVLTILLTLGLSVTLSTAYRANVRANWDTYRCDPGVVLTARLYRPPNDPRSDDEFARANAEFCQKEFIQDAIRTAAKTPMNLANLQASTVAIVDAAVEDSADVFVHVWKFCFEAYSSFMDNMKGAAKLFQNFMIQMYTIVQRLQTSVLAVVFGLIALITAFISSIQLVLIVAIVIIGIVIALQIILFFLLLPISGLIVTMTALISTVVISVGTAIAAATVSEMFDGASAACFIAETPIRCSDGLTRPIQTIHVGSMLANGCRVTAVHKFRARSELFDLGGITVTGDHLVMKGDAFIAVSEHPCARSIGIRDSELWCLTTSTRRIPVDSPFVFADWEEIPEDDVKALAMWKTAVWRRLNGCEEEECEGEEECGDAGFTQNTRVIVVVGDTCEWRHMRDVQLGDQILDGSSSTIVVGIVHLEGDMETDMIQLNKEFDAWATKGTWIFDGNRWSSPKTCSDDMPHPIRLMHLYTQSGTFTVEGRLQVRDASEVGLAGLKSLVDAIVLYKSLH